MRPVDRFLIITAIIVTSVSVLTLIGWHDYTTTRDAFLQMKGK